MLFEYLTLTLSFGLYLLTRSLILDVLIKNCEVNFRPSISFWISEINSPSKLITEFGELRALMVRSAYLTTSSFYANLKFI